MKILKRVKRYHTNPVFIEIYTSNDETTSFKGTRRSSNEE